MEQFISSTVPARVEVAKIRTKTNSTISKAAFCLDSRTLGKGVVTSRTNGAFARELRRVRFLRYCNLFGLIVAIRNGGRAQDRRPVIIDLVVPRFHLVLILRPLV
jgi:hypothetical protein